MKVEFQSKAHSHHRCSLASDADYWCVLESLQRTITLRTKSHQATSVLGVARWLQLVQSQWNLVSAFGIIQCFYPHKQHETCVASNWYWIISGAQLYSFAAIAHSNTVWNAPGASCGLTVKHQHEPGPSDLAALPPHCSPSCQERLGAAIPDLVLAPPWFVQGLILRQCPQHTISACMIMQPCAWTTTTSDCMPTCKTWRETTSTANSHYTKHTNCDDTPLVNNDTWF